MRAVLLLNPSATATDDAVRDVIVSALSSALDLEVHATKQRGHATHMAAGAVHDGADVVFVLGGDGTTNEVLQAVAATEVILGVIPGGGANVFARALGLPNDAVGATAVLLERLREGKYRRIGLGRAGGRYFGFNAGFGFDAAVVRLVEQHAHLKRAVRQMAFVWAAGREWATGLDRSSPSIEVLGTAAPQSEHGGPYSIAVVSNTDPYTYLGDRPLRATPQASFDTGLDLLAVSGLSTLALFRLIGSAFRDARHVSHAGVQYWHDLDDFSLRSARPQPLMVDGDYAGEFQTVRFEAVPDALSVLA